MASLATLAVAATALAQEAPAVLPAEAVPANAPAPADSGLEWYGTAIIVTDLASASLFGCAFADTITKHELPSLSWFGAGLATYALGGPIVHLAYGQGSAAAESLGVRVVGVLIGGLTGALIGKAADGACREEFCGGPIVTGAFVGASVGAGAVSAFDIGMLAYRPSAKGAQMALMPSADPSKGAGSLSLVGTW